MDHAAEIIEDDRTIAKKAPMIRFHDWSDLQGVAVLIKKNGRRVRSGHVEAVTPAADVLWLEGHGVEPRTLFHKDEGYEVWLDPANLAEKLNGPTSRLTIDHVYSNEEGERIILPLPID